MVSNEEYCNLSDWFNSYSNSFLKNDENYKKNIKIKIDHTQRVVNIIDELCSTLKLNQNDSTLAKIIALFHDVGRFHQYQHYGTYRDKISENHALLGIKIIEQNKLLEKLEKNESKLILDAISFHNRVSIPETSSEKTIFFSKLIRDADKIDIYKVVTDHYLNPSDIFRNSIEMGLPNISSISDKIFNSIMNDKIVNFNEIETLDDFKVLQMAWIFDLNFQYSYEIVNKNRYLNVIYESMDKSDALIQIFDHINQFLQKKIHK